MNPNLIRAQIAELEAGRSGELIFELLLHGKNQPEADREWASEVQAQIQRQTGKPLNRDLDRAIRSDLADSTQFVNSGATGPEKTVCSFTVTISGYATVVNDVPQTVRHTPSAFLTIVTCSAF